MTQGVPEQTLRHHFAEARERSDFGNARTARTLLERAREAQALRLGPQLIEGTADLVSLTDSDIETAIAVAHDPDRR